MFLRLPNRCQIIKELFPVRKRGWKLSPHREPLERALEDLPKVNATGFTIVTGHREDIVRLQFPERSKVGPKIDIDRIMTLGQKSKLAFFMALEATLWFGRLNHRVMNNGHRWYQVSATGDQRDRYQISKAELMEWSQRDWYQTKKALRLMEELEFCRFENGLLVPHEKWSGWGSNSRGDGEYMRVPS